MKNIKSIFLMVATLLIVATSFAQTSGTRNIQEGLVFKVTTTNNTATQIQGITVANNETGILEVTVWGQVSDTSGFVSGRLTYKYHKTSAGTLTVVATDTIQAVTTGIGVTGALFAVSAVSNNLSLKVTGVNSKTIRWRAITKQWYTKND